MVTRCRSVTSLALTADLSLRILIPSISPRFFRGSGSGADPTTSATVDAGVRRLRLRIRVYVCSGAAGGMRLCLTEAEAGLMGARRALLGLHARPCFLGDPVV